MVSMDITSLPKNGLKIKSKRALIAIDSIDKSASYNGSILIDAKLIASQPSADYVFLQGPGEYEVGGIKIAGTKSGTEEGATVYSLDVDGISVLVGDIADVGRIQQKLKEYDIAILKIDSVVDSSFATGLASSAILFYGDKASEVVESLTKETVKKTSKYTTTHDKLPSEMETVLLTA